MTTPDYDQLKHAAQLATAVWLESYCGPRCPDRDPDCPVCQHWDAFDLLFFALSPETKSKPLSELTRDEIRALIDSM